MNDSLKAERVFREKAEEHWKWLETWLHIIYVDAMVHGYKHGLKEVEDEFRKATKNSK